MGGKVWNKQEQYYFVYTVMPRSHFNGENGAYNPKYGKSWAYLAIMMQAAMSSKGIERRIYNKSMLYEHWYQTVKKTWGETHAKMLRDSAPRSARGGTDRTPRSRAKKTKQRAKKNPSAPTASTESNRRANGPGPQNDAVSVPYTIELPLRASNHSRLDEFSASSEISYTSFQGHNAAPARYHGTPMTSDLPPSGQFNPYGASEAPYQTHAEGVVLYQQQIYWRPELQIRDCFQPVNEDRRDPAPPASLNHPFPHHQHQHQQLRLTEPTPEYDDTDETSLFVQPSEQELTRRLPTTRARASIELDAARTMTMLFREQHPHFLHTVLQSQNRFPRLRDVL
ncbi:hypothetical protein DSL72_009169 [Monilinia vaccinii-corymbosi]|uniref:Uncharacterized protein n=1 Tax=Monilinia vaccinii-corymbosi TaxID=61207 RepID=A0A8A3PNL9_9HELO|nr:hypothetical protein DSL72_009169 [Monilinia vaccinii-corymbosi]